MATGKEVAEAYIEVHGDLKPFRRALTRVRGAIAKNNAAMQKENRSTFDQLQDSATKALLNIKNRVGGLGDKFAETLNGMGDLSKTLTSNMVADFSRWGDKAKSTSKDVWTRMSRAAEKATKSVSGSLRGMRDSIRDSTNYMVSAYKKAWGKVTRSSSRGAKDFGKSVGGMRDDIDDVGVSMEKLVGVVKTVNGKIVDSSEDSWGLVKTVAVGAAEKIKKSWSRMDSTVRTVVGLLAAAADQMVTVASGAAAAGTALVSSLALALASAVPLADIFAGLVLTTILAVQAFDDLVKKVDGIKESMDSIGKSWDKQVDDFGDAWGGALADLLESFDKQFAKYDFGKQFGKAMSKITQSFEDVVNGSAFKAFMKALTDEIPKAVEGIGKGFARVMEAVMSTMAAAAPVAQQLGRDFSAWGAALAKVAEEARKSGVMAETFELSRESLLALLDLAGASANALGTVFLVGAKYGNELITSLTGMTRAFDKWAESARGQAALNEWFKDGVRIIKAMEPAMVGLGRALSILVTEAAIQRWIGLNEAIGRLLPTLAETLSVIGELDILTHITNLLNTVTTAFAAMSGPLTTFAQLLDGILGRAIEALGTALLGIANALNGPLAAAMPALESIGLLLVSTFEPLVRIVVEVAQVLASILTPAITTIAVIFEELRAPLMSLVEVLGTALLTAVQNLAPTFHVIAQVFNQLVSVAGALLVALMPTAELLGQVFASALAQLAPIINKVFTALGNLLIPALNSLLPIIAGLAPVIHDLVASFLAWASEGLAMVGPLLQSLVPMVQGLVPIFQAWGQVLLQMLPFLQQVGAALMEHLMVGLQAIMPAIQQLLPVVGQLAVTFAEFAAGVLPIIAELFVNLVAVITPLIPMLVQIATTVLQLAGTFLNNLLPALLPVLATLGEAFIQVITAIAPVLVQLVGAVLQLATVFISQLLPALLPIIVALGEGLGKILVALAPVVLQILTAVAQLAVTFLSQLLPAILPLLPVVLQLVNMFVAVLIPAIKAVGAIIQFIMPLVLSIVTGVINGIIDIVQGVVKVIKGVVNVIEGIFTLQWSQVWTGMKQIVSGAVQAIWGFINVWIIGRLVGGIKAALKAIFGSFKKKWDDIRSTVGGAVEKLKTGVINGLNAVSKFVGRILGNIAGFFKRRFNEAKSVATNAINTAKSRISNAMNNIWGTVQRILGRVGNFFRNTWNNVKSTVANAMDRLGSSVSSGISKVVGFVRGLPGKALGALGNIGSKLYSAGADLIRGFIQGVKNMAGNIARAALDAVGNAVSAVKDFLGINSPSKLFIGFGENTGEGMVIGIDHMKSAVARAADDMASMTTAAFAQSKMRIAGLNAAKGLADGLKANGGLVKNALGNINPKVSASVDRLGQLPTRQTFGTPATQGVGNGKVVNISEGAIKLVSQVSDPKLAAGMLLDDIATHSMMG